MRTILKKGLTIIFAAILLMCIIPAQSVNAAPKGTIDNPVNLKTGGKCTPTIKPANDSIGTYYVKFKMKKNGYATITLSKFDKASETISLALYNQSTHSMIWQVMNLENRLFESSKNYSFKVGLGKGSYYLGVKSLSNYSGAIKHTISIKTTPNAYWENEASIDSYTNENYIKLNKKYTGVILGSRLDSDYFYIDIQKGKKYKIQVGNYKSIKSRAGIAVLDNRGKTVYTYNKLPSAGTSLVNTGSTIFKAESTGKYKVIFSNPRFYGDQYYSQNGFIGIQYTLKVSPVK